jgi:hypothetical protein
MRDGMPDDELYRRVDKVLHYVWDPIGVSGIPEARDEYYAYLPDVMPLVQAEAGVGRIAAYLTEVETNRIGLAANKERAEGAAEIMVEWNDLLGRRRREPPVR